MESSSDSQTCSSSVFRWSADLSLWTHSSVEPRPDQTNRHHNTELFSESSPCDYVNIHPVSTECVLKLRSALEKVCGMQWYAYAALGIWTAILSVLMDLSVGKLLTAHQWLYMQLDGNSVLQFFCWTLYPACLCAVASSFCHHICPFSTGSGIPEVRTMLAGVELPQYLSLTNMFTKFLGLICTLAAGSTVFLGKVGPFVHLSTMMGQYFNKLCTLIQSQKTETAAGEMLAVSAAVGVASCFGAPISGVLFSVEVMGSHFAVSHYCPCFFSATCGALTFRLFSVWTGDEETVQAMFKTNFPSALPFYPLEILLFALLGLLCGAVSCCFLFCHRWILLFAKTNPVFSQILTTEKALYSGIVAFLLASVTFPHAAGQYMASKYTMKQLLTSLLQAKPWGCQSHNASVQLECDLWLEWSSSDIPVLLSLVVFLLMKLWMLVLTCTLPVPAGYFMPVFIYGAAMGRFLGEGLVSVLSTVTSGQQWDSINPGGYALAGAAAFSGAVTHTLSPALLTLELTGQVTHAAPIFLATLLANAVARSRHRLSFYDALSISKRLPHLPSLEKACSRIPSTTIGQFLGAKSVQIQKAAGRVEVQLAVNTSTEGPIPVVDSHGMKILLLFYYTQPQKHLEEVCFIHPPSVLLSPLNTVQETHRILSLTGTQTVFVVDQGRLMGLITWSQMKRILEDLAKDI
uniref:Chloride channel K n=1 Tax=Sphaeramia orbicularis TaxID=375764 RepID=A0A672YRB7_9TELE